MIDEHGHLVIHPRFEEYRDFAEGLAAVRLNGKWGYIDNRAQLAILPRFEDAGDFSGGLAGVRLDHRWGYINTLGEMVVTPRSFSHADFKDGLALLRLPEGFGYVNARGEVVIEPRFSWALDFSEGLAGIRIHNKWGYIDTSGNMTIAPRFDAARPFSEGLAGVKIEGKWGFVDRSGKMVIEPAFGVAWPFSDGLAIVCTACGLDGKWGFVDRNGEIVIGGTFTSVSRFSEGLAAVGVDFKHGYVGRNGEFAIPPQFSVAGDFCGGLAQVWTGDGLGQKYVDKTGRIVWERPRKKADRHITVSLSGNAFRPIPHRDPEPLFDWTQPIRGNTMSEKRPGNVRKQPASSGGTPQYGVIRLGRPPGNEFHFMLIKKSHSPPRFFFDRNRNGDLTDDGGPIRSLAKDTSSFWTILKIPFSLHPENASQAADLEIMFSTTTYRETGFDYCVLTPLKGMVRMAGKAYDAYVAEREVHDGDFTNDGIYVDIDRDGTIDHKTEHFRPSQVATVDGIAYEFEITW